MTAYDSGGAWHADPSLLAAYASGSLDLARCVSVEQHVLRCVECRAAVAPRADTAVLDRGWAGVVDMLDQPRMRLFERALRRCGLPAADARVAAAASVARQSWLIATAIGIAFALAFPRPGDRLAPWFLVLAPLVPLTGVAVAYGRDIDPMYEIVTAAPVAKLRLVLLRSLLVLPFTVLVLLAGGSVLPGGLAMSALWLLPAFGLVALTLAVEPWFGGLTGAAGVAVAWVGVVVTVGRMTGSVLHAFGAPGQAVSGLVLFVAAAVIAVGGGEPASRRLT